MHFSVVRMIKFIINFNIVLTGDVTKGEVGFAAILGEEENFKKSIEKTIEYANALNCKMSVYR